jgi:hypothetical protein
MGLLLASSTSPRTTTWQSLQHQLRQSSPLTLHSMPLSMPQPIGLPPLCANEQPSMLRRSPKPSRKLSNSSKSTSSGHKTTNSCKLDWASSAFPMALSIMRAESPLQSQQEEAEWWSRNGSDQSGMGRWNYWPGGSLGNPPMLQSFSSSLTILRPLLPRQQLCGSSPSSPAGMEVSTPSSKRPAASITQQWSLRYCILLPATRGRMNQAHQ